MGTCGIYVGRPGGHRNGRVASMQLKAYGRWSAVMDVKPSTQPTTGLSSLSPGHCARLWAGISRACRDEWLAAPGTDDVPERQCGPGPGEHGQADAPRAGFVGSPILLSCRYLNPRASRSAVRSATPPAPPLRGTHDP